MRLLPLLALLLAAPSVEAASLPSSLKTDAAAAARTVLPLKRAAPAGRIGRFARLAGMFMGTVDCASMGPMKFRLVLDLR